MSFLIALIAFIITIGVLVTVHEFGHFLIAKKFNIKVLRFSIGFGKILKSYKLGETTYTLCAIPFGGFVKMLDENEEAVNDAEKHRAFNTQNVYKRIAVVIAGPAANFILAIIFYTIVFMLGTTGIKPIIGQIKTDSIAQQSGLLIGDQLFSINNRPTPSINEFVMQFMQSNFAETIKLTVISTSKELKTIDLQPRDDFLANPEQNIEAYLGFKFALPKLKAIINKVLPNSPAAIAGIQTGDEIIEVNNQKIDSWQMLVRLIKNNANQTMKLQIIRNQQKINLTLTPKTKAGISVLVPENYLKQWQVLTQKDFTQSFLAASIKTYEISILNLKIIQKMILGNISLSQISGPIGIANYAGKTAEIGVGAFLSFLAIVSIGLGLLNLLPIPLLDGGHLFFYLLEIIKGSPVSKTIQQAATKIGLFIILFLTIIAVYNDLLNLLFSP